MGYLVFGGLMTATLAMLPFCFRLAQLLDASHLGSLSPSEVVDVAVGPPDTKAYAFFFITTVQRICLTGLFFFMMCVAERTYKQVIFLISLGSSCVFYCYLLACALWVPRRCNLNGKMHFCTFLSTRTLSKKLFLHQKLSKTRLFVQH